MDSAIGRSILSEVIRLVEEIKQMNSTISDGICDSDFTKYDKKILG